VAIRARADLPVRVPANFGEDEIRAHLEAQGYTRVFAQRALVPGPSAADAGEGSKKRGAKKRKRRRN